MQVTTCTLQRVASVISSAVSDQITAIPKADTVGVCRLALIILLPVTFHSLLYVATLILDGLLPIAGR